MKITTEHILSDESVAALYPTYVVAFEPLMTKAAARHVLTAEEFAKEMNDPRIAKFVVRDDGDRVIGLSTVTTDLSVIDWINAHYYTARYPDVVARGALFYLGYTLVDCGRRLPNALRMMASELNRQVAEVQGVLGFDICGYNVTNGIGRHPAHLLRSSQRIDTLDTQTYYAADFRPQASPDLEDPTVPPAISATTQIGPVRVVTVAERVDLAERVDEVLASRWPVYLLAGQPRHSADLVEVLASRPTDQLMLLDDRDQVHGVALSVPLRWDGTTAGLPAGWDDAIERSVQQERAGVSPNTTCALSITIAPTAARQNLAATLVNGLKEVARSAGSRALLAPIRPILKADYPLVDMASYLTWRTADGRVFDPWLRLHLREGAELLRVAPDSMTVSGSVEDWQRWTGTTFPGSGDFVIDGGLVPLHVDVEAGTAVYREPNVWLAHHLTQ